MSDIAFLLAITFSGCQLRNCSHNEVFITVHVIKEFASIVKDGGRQTNGTVT